MRERMEKALRSARADYAEIRIEDIASSSVSYRGADLDRADASSSIGGIVRAVHKGGTGVATFNSLDHLENRVAEACESARLVGSDSTRLAEAPVVEHEERAALKRDFREVPLAEKKAMVEAYNGQILNHADAMETTNVFYADSFRAVRFANTDGSYLYDERPDTLLYLGAVARDGDNVQRATESVGGVRGYQVVEGMEAKAEEAAQRAVDLLSAPPVEGGTYTVVTNPRMTGVFAHEAFGHLSEADFVYENERMQELLVLGERFGPDMLNIVDDGTVPDLRGTHPYDDEGVATRKNYLIKSGILAGRLHSRETAARLGEPVTGNARALGHSSRPIVRMTNTCIEAGDTSFEDMIKDIELGVYACDMVGGQTAMEMFTFSAAYAYMIRNGQVTELVRDVVLAGNVFETLRNIDCIGDTLEWSRGGGGCGKGGQSGLPVGLGGPHVRIQNVVVGGK